MAEKKPIQFQGRTVLGQSIDFQATSPEAWNTYQLADGTTMKAKLVLLNVIRLDEYAPDGSPIYQFQAQQIIALEAAENLKRKVHPNAEKKIQ